MNSTLDINTERGRKFALDQKVAVEIVFGPAYAHRFKFTSDEGPAAADGIILHNDVIAGVVEIKSRPDMTHERLMGERNGEWLLTKQKLDDLQSLSRLLRVPGFGFLYLPASELVLAIRLTSADGTVCCHFREEKTRTQATCNGGVAWRANAFIDMRGSRIYRKAQPC
jgi:hypothetical protein